MKKTTAPEPNPQNNPKELKNIPLAPDVSGISPLHQLTQNNVFHLQRMIGNQGVQRLIASGSVASRRIQRANTADSVETGEGLMDQKAPNRFAQKVYDFTRDPNNANTPITQLTDVMQVALNEELAVLGIPHVAVILGNAGGNSGQTTSSTWSIEFNPNVAFGGLSKTLSDVSQEQIAEATDTMYHEGRHIEQFFRVAQLSVIEMLNKGIKLEVIKPELVERLGLSEVVIDSAASSSVDLNLDPSLVKKIKLWAKGFYGANKNYTDIVYTMKEKTLKYLGVTIKCVFDLVPPEYEHLPLAQQEAIKAQLPMWIGFLETDFKTLAEYQETDLMPELQRLRALMSGPHDDNDTIMRGHLLTLIQLTRKILANNQLSASDPDALVGVLMTVNRYVEEIKTELLAADAQLPEQKDANSAGDAVEQALKELQDGWW